VKRDNGSAAAKAKFRNAVARSLPDEARILEGFAGEGRMYRACWSAFSGATIDKNETKARDAARARPTWAVYSGDTERALWAGWMSRVPFDVVDLDAYGSPWPFVRAWFDSERTRAPTTHLVLTDGYMRQASMAPPCRALFPNRKGQRFDCRPEMYHSAMVDRLAEWSGDAGLRAELVRSVKDRNMVLHQIEVRSG